MRIAYIDSQNIKLGVREAGREMDWEKFFVYMKQRYNLDQIKYFVGYLPDREHFYGVLKKIGYVIVFKKSHVYYDDKGKLKTKGNVDALIMKVGINDADSGLLTKAYLYSGDGDFEVLIDYRKEKGVFGKLFLPNYKKISKLLIDCTDSATINNLQDLQKKLQQIALLELNGVPAHGSEVTNPWGSNNSIIKNTENASKSQFKVKTIVITSGYFNPLHPGHIECIQMCKQLGDELWVIVNSDHQARLKTGQDDLFQDQEFRMTVVSSLKAVDRVMLSVDMDGSVCESIRTIADMIRSEYGSDTQIIFGKGGDRFAGNIPEVAVCQECDIQICDGLGSKTHNSSEYRAKRL